MIKESELNKSFTERSFFEYMQDIASFSKLEDRAPFGLSINIFYKWITNTIEKGRCEGITYEMKVIYKNSVNELSKKIPAFIQLLKQRI